MPSPMRGVWAGAMLLAVAGAARAADVPDQFKAWGTFGKDIRWRTLGKRQADKMRQAGKTEAQIEFQRKTYDARHWPEVQLEAEKPRTAFTRAEKQQGCVLFARHYMDRVYYYTVPKADERISELRVFAAQGEFEPAERLTADAQTSLLFHFDAGLEAESGLEGVKVIGEAGTVG